MTRPIVSPIIEWDEYTGRLDAIDSVEVRARVSGYLESIHFSEGELVSAGDLLFVIDRRPFEAELNAAQAGLVEAQARERQAESRRREAEAVQADARARLSLKNKQLARANELLAQNAISREEVDVRESEQLQAVATGESAAAAIESAKAAIATAKASIESARATVVTAELNLSYTQVRAPIDGRISRRYITEGNLYHRRQSRQRGQHAINAAHNDRLHQSDPLLL